MQFRVLSLLLFFIFSQNLTAQKTSVKGVVYDYAEKKPIEFASLRLSDLDSIAVAATSSDKKGDFELMLDAGKYILTTSFLGYDSSVTSFNVAGETSVINLDTIFLLDKSIELDGLSVIGKPPAIAVKGDTIEYSVNSYQTDENDVLQDIIRKLPGVELDANGNLTANGKPIDKILIDGKEFFGNDIQRALRDLPAKMIRKIQLFKKDTDEAEQSGFKSEENQEQVLNLQVEEEAKKSIFGDVEAGYGTEDKYNVSGNVYRMRDEKQLMLSGSVNNISQQYGGMGFGSSGIEENKDFSLSYNIENPKKMSLETSLNYGDNKNINRTRSETQYFLEGGDRFSQGNSSSESRSKDLSGDFRLRWTPDTLTSIFFSGSLRHSNTDRNSFYDNKSYVADTTFTTTNSSSNGISDAGNLSVFGSRQLGKKDRRLMFGLRGSLRDGDEIGYNESATTYSSPTELPIELDQRSETDSKMRSWSANVNYVEPLAEGKLLRISYSFDKNVATRDKETLKKNEAEQYALVDTAYTRFSKSSYMNHKIGMGFQSKKEKYYYNINLDVLPQVLRTTVSFRDSIIDDLEQKVVNYSPTLMFSWTPEKDKTLTINYSGMTQQPNLSQLSSDTILLSTTNKQYGNPNLKTGFRNNLNLNYNSSNTEKEEFFGVYSGMNYSLNSVVNYSLMDDLGRTETTYRNVDGNMGAYIGANYSRMIKKIRTSAYVGGNYSRNKGFVNGFSSVSDSYGISVNLNLSYSHDKIDAYLQGSVSSNFTSSNLSSSQNLDMTNYGIMNRLTWRMPLDFTFNNDISFSHNSKVSDDLPQANTLWNLTLSKSLLKGKKGTLKLYVNNVLNEKNDIQRVVTDSQLSYSRTHSIGRYVLLSFAYKFNIIGK